MKTRQGFVSNSSSSSFIVFGKYLADSEEEKIDQEKMEELGYELNCSEDGYSIGCDPSEMKDDETLLQFKTRIAKEIETIGVKAKPADLRFIGGEAYDNC
jgi:hypothetical protein